VATRSSARLRIEKHPIGAAESSGFHVVQTCVALVSRSQHPPELVDSDLWIDEPLQRALGPCGVEGPVRLVDGESVADREPGGAHSSAGALASDAQHRRTGVDPDDLARGPEVFGECQRRVAETAADVEESLALDEAEAVPLPGAECDRCVPPCSRVHRGDKDRDVLVVVNSLVTETVGVAWTHSADPTTGLVPDPSQDSL
jgi:hypothetical protein